MPRGLGLQDIDRTVEIIKLGFSGTHTLQEIGDGYGVSRERIRQIFKIATGKDWGEIHKEKNTKLRQKEHERKLDSIRFTCAGCKRKVTYREGYHSHKYCKSCLYLSKKELRDPMTTLVCDWCETKFHPFRVRKHYTTPKSHKFCSRACHGYYRNYLLAQSFIKLIRVGGELID